MREFKYHFLIIACVWSIWLSTLGLHEALQVVIDNIAITLTMLLGSFVAGSTSVGGGAVAFPIFTKVLHIDSQTALIFSLAIQSIGMAAASILIFANRIPIHFRIIKLSLMPGALGMFIGLFYVRFLIASPDIKYLFSCFSFFIALALTSYHFRNKDNKSLGFTEAPLFIVSMAAFLGGILSGIIGIGIDFIIFTLMIFLWNFDFKIATATSVVVMACNAFFGFVFSLLEGNLFTGEVVNYWLAAIPVVVIGAPLGALACKHLPKSIIFYLLLCLIIIDIVSTIIILGIKLQFILPMLLIVSFTFLLQKMRQ